MSKQIMRLTLALSFLLFAGNLSAQQEGVSKVGITAAPFLEIGVGSRAVGMGGAYVGVANDASSLYWNPSGIAWMTRNEMLFVHTEWLADLKFDFIGAVVPLGKIGTIGASVTVLSMGDMEVRTIQYQHGTGEKFSATDFAAAFSYARPLTDRFSIGANFKYIQQRIWHMSASTIAMDIGTLYKTPVKGLRIGTTISNFGPGMRLQGKDVYVYHDVAPEKLGNNDQILSELRTESWPLPLNFQAGVAYDAFNTQFHRLTVAIDALHPSDNTESINTGFEYGINNTIFIRGGLKSLFQRDTEESFTLGGGLHYNLFGRGQIRVDYSYADFGRLNNVQRFSFAVSF